MKIENIKVVWEVEAALKSRDVFSITCESGDEVRLCRENCYFLYCGIDTERSKLLNDAIHAATELVHNAPHRQFV